MDGSATFTSVMSNRSMKMATQTMIRARHLRSMGEKLLKENSAMLIRKVSDYRAHAVTSAPAHAREDAYGSLCGQVHRLRQPQRRRRRADPHADSRRRT